MSLFLKGGNVGCVVWGRGGGWGVDKMVRRIWLFLGLGGFGLD